jgi:hypothetical protein
VTTTSVARETQKPEAKVTSNQSSELLEASAAATTATTSEVSEVQKLENKVTSNNPSELLESTPSEASATQLILK